MMGMTTIIMVCWLGSIVVGVSFCCRIIEAPMITGRIRNGRSRKGTMNSTSGDERSLIHPMNGACLSANELCSA